MPPVDAATVAGMLDAARAGDRGALARLVTLAERGGDDGRVVAGVAHRRGAHAHVVGLTGAPGAGKSTLAAALLPVLRARGEPVAVLAVDPTSPFTGGSILGDRVRMQAPAVDEGVFVRSLATRGDLGGLSPHALDAVRVLDAAGWAWIVLETVGVGQVELDVAHATDTTVVVVNPGWGDAVQAHKSGLLEVADVFVVNKADRGQAEEARTDLRSMLALGPHRPWRPPIVLTSASTGDGVDELVGAVDDHRRFLTDSGELARRRAARAEFEVLRIVQAMAVERARSSIGRGDGVTDQVAARQLDPWAAADLLTRR